jgi:hypothetical protein
MAWNSSTGAVVVTLGATTTPGSVSTTGTQTSNYIWRPDPVYDRAGNVGGTTAYTEPNPPVDRDW